MGMHGRAERTMQARCWQLATHDDCARRGDVGLEAEVDGGAIGGEVGHRARERVRHFELRAAHGSAVAIIVH